MSKLYAATINGNELYRVTDTPNEDTLYELTETASGSYRFSLYPRAAGRAAARPGVLEGSNVQMLSNERTKIFITGFGTAVKDSYDGTFRIHDRLFVRLAGNDTERGGLVQEVIDVATGMRENANEPASSQYAFAAHQVSQRLDEQPSAPVRAQINAKLDKMNDAQLLMFLRNVEQIEQKFTNGGRD